MIRKILDRAFAVPSDSLVNGDKSLNSIWERFFIEIVDRLGALGIERSFKLKDNTANQEIEGLQFDGSKVSVAFIDYIAQRISLDPGATELIEAGILKVVYKPRAKTWSLIKYQNGPDDAGVTFNVTAAGQVRVSTSDMTGFWTAGSVSKIAFRSRILAAKTTLAVSE